MRHLFMMVVCILVLTGCHDDHLNEVQNELHQQRQANNGLVGAVFVLGIGCTVLFGVGAAIGAKARKEVRKKND